MRVNVETRGIKNAKRLAKILGISHEEAIGHLVLFWEHTQDLEIYDGEPDDIAFYFDPDQKFDPDLVITGLLKSLFLRASSCTRLVISGNQKNVDYLKQKREAGKKGGSVGKSGISKNNNLDESHAQSVSENPVSLKAKPQSRLTQYNAIQSNTQQSKAMQSNAKQYNTKQNRNRDSDESLSLRDPQAPEKLLPELWNSNCGNLPKVRSPGELSSTRKRSVLTRWKEHPNVDHWTQVIRKLSESRFCNGENSNGWVATFDFMLKPDSVEKILEGKYDNRDAPKNKSIDNAQKLWEEIHK